MGQKLGNLGKTMLCYLLAPKSKKEQNCTENSSITVQNTTLEVINQQLAVQLGAKGIYKTPKMA